jgi:hypothetical protein
MGGSAVLHTISFMAVVVMILLTVWIALVLESGGDPPARNQQAGKPGDEPGQAAAPSATPGSASGPPP